MRSFIFAVMMLTICINGCTKRTSEYFPLVPGAVRVMKVYERKVVGKDTSEKSEVRVVEIVRGEKTIPQLGKVWVMETPLDSLRRINYFYQKHNDTIFKIVPGRGGKPERIIYLIQPLEVHRQWFDSEAERELTEVVAQESVNVPAGLFLNTYRIHTESNRANFQQTLWLAPGVGVVKREKRQRWSKGKTNYELYQVEELVGYQVMKKDKSRPK
ncbi:MAG: hypothetical protein ABIK39_01985 [candidate division WOR-3 bacterium]